MIVSQPYYTLAAGVEDDMDELIPELSISNLEGLGSLAEELDVCGAEQTEQTVIEKIKSFGGRLIDIEDGIYQLDAKGVGTLIAYINKHLYQLLVMRSENSKEENEEKKNLAKKRLRGLLK